MREQFNDALKRATKDRDKRRIGTLRLIIAAIRDRDIAARSADSDSGASPGAAPGIPDDDILTLLGKMIKQRNESAQTYDSAGRAELATQEREEIAIIKEFLPAQMSDTEIRQAVETTITDLNASGLKDMGRIMADLKSRHAGKMDFSKASGIVKELMT